MLTSKIRITTTEKVVPISYDVASISFIGSNETEGGHIWISSDNGNPDNGLYHLKSINKVLDCMIKISPYDDNKREFTCL